MAKTRTKYVCQNCGRQAPKYMGRCPQCGEFNTMQEFVEEKRKPAKQNRQVVGTVRNQPQRLTEISTEEEERLHVPVEEFSRVLGGWTRAGQYYLARWCRVLGNQPC